MGQELYDYNALWAQQAQAAADAEPVASSQFFSVQGGRLTLGEEEFPGNQAVVIVIDAAIEHTFYTERWTADNPVPPVCYAFGRDGDEMVPQLPDDPYFKKQSEACAGCPQNEWGSSDTGRGKACQNRRRLTLLPAGWYEPRAKGSRDLDLNLIEDIEHYASADAAFLRLPVTSVEPWSKYVHHLASREQRPPHGVVTRVHVTEDPKGHAQYALAFEMLDRIPDDMARTIIERAQAAHAMPFKPYEPPRDAPQRGRQTLRGLRR